MLKRIQSIIFAARPWSFSMTAISVTLGSLAGLRSRPLHWFDYLVVLTGMVVVHAATNLLNDLFDFLYGIDHAGSPTTLYRRHPLVSGDFSLLFIAGLTLACYAGAALIGLYLFLTHGWIIALFALIGGLASVCYTVGPVKYKQRALGELAVFLMWGPLMMSAAYFIQVGNWSQIGTVLLISIPQGLWVALVLLANNLKDITYDRESTVRTLGTVLGRERGIRLYRAMVCAIYGSTLLEIIIGVIPVWGVLTVLSVPAMLKLIRRFYREPAIPVGADPLTAQIGMIYGILLLLALILARLFSA